MPIYPCKCSECGNETEVFRTVANYQDLPLCCGNKMNRVYTPLHVIEDIKPYRSLIDGSVISSRSEHKKHLKQHGCVEVGNEKPTPKAKPKKDDSLKRELYQKIYG